MIKQDFYLNNVLNFLSKIAISDDIRQAASIIGTSFQHSTILFKVWFETYNKKYVRSKNKKSTFLDILWKDKF